MIVKLAMFEPKTLPTDNPPSLPNDAKIDTESSGKEVDTDSRTNPAAISESPKTFDSTKVYLIILSLTMAIRKRETPNKIVLNQIMLKHTL